MASVRRIADKVAMLHNGVIVWTGPTDDMDKWCSVHQFVHGLEEGVPQLIFKCRAIIMARSTNMPVDAGVLPVDENAIMRGEHRWKTTSLAWKTVTGHCVALEPLQIDKGPNLPPYKIWN